MVRMGVAPRRRRQTLMMMTQRVTPRSRAEVTKFFDGLDLIESGVVPIPQWRPDGEADAAARAGMWGGVGKKP